MRAGAASKIDAVAASVGMKEGVWPWPCVVTLPPLAGNQPAVHSLREVTCVLSIFGLAATVSREERGRSAPVAVRRYAECQLKMLIAEAARSAPKSICLSETTHPCALVPPFQQLGEDVFCGSREHHAAPAQVDR